MTRDKQTAAALKFLRDVRQVQAVSRKRAKASQILLDDIRVQYERRQLMVASAGGDPDTMQGSLTAYLDYGMLRGAFGPEKKPKGKKARLRGLDKPQ